MKEFLRLARIVVAAAAAVLLFFGSFGRAGWSNIVMDAGVALLFSVLIGVPAQLLLPRLGPFIFRRTTPPLNWILLIATMMAIATVGSLAAIAVLIALGLLAPEAFPGFLVSALRVSMAISLTFGVGITLYERMRHRAITAELALRTKERDEADARRMASEARLASLEARVQPHFLFNTLNSIAALIPQDPAGAERMTARLASLLRSSLDDADSPLVALGHEVQSTRHYLEIEQVRFGDRLRFTIDVPEVLSRTQVPRFALQTLVENSVKYAVFPRREGAHIRITADGSPGRVRIAVEDDGPGFDGDHDLPHHGLSLLRERLALAYAGGASLLVESRPAHSRVQIEVPA